MAILSLGVASAQEISDYVRFEKAVYVEHPANDGDSFYVNVGNSNLLVRLYGADTPETRADADVFARRVAEQARYFGLPSAWHVVRYGAMAKQVTRELLSQPFTVYTVFTPALGHSEGGRIYAFVVLADGRDLAEVLVEKGMARAYGVTRRTPWNDSREEYAAHLQEVEMAAAIQRVGIWKDTDPHTLVLSRARDRAERKSRTIPWKGRVPLDLQWMDRIDINSASENELQLLRGIGPVLAKRIVAGRPYRSLEDLRRVPGLSGRLLQELAPFLTVGSSESAQIP